MNIETLHDAVPEQVEAPKLFSGTIVCCWYLETQNWLVSYYRTPEEAQSHFDMAVKDRSYGRVKMIRVSESGLPEPKGKVIYDA